MTVTGQDRTMYAGDDKTLRFTLVDEKGEPLDLTDVVLEWVLRDGAQIVLRKTSDDGIAIASASAGVFDVTLAPADTEDLAAKQYAHGAVISVEDGQYDTISVGTLTVLPMVRAASPPERPMMFRTLGLTGLGSEGPGEEPEEPDAPPDEPVTLEEAKAFLRVEHDEDDGLIASLIAAAREISEQYIGRSLVPGTAEDHDLGYAQGEVPGPIRLAILRTVATHYENREDESVGTVVARLSANAEALLGAYRVVGL